jgi:hypothetical protein
MFPLSYHVDNEAAKTHVSPVMKRPVVDNDLQYIASHAIIPTRNRVEFEKKNDGSGKKPCVPGLIPGSRENMAVNMNEMVMIVHII